MERLAQFLLLQFQPPGGEGLSPVAVLLLDPSQDKLHIRGRKNFDDIADALDALVLVETVKQLDQDASMQSGRAILDLLESTLSNSIRLTERIDLQASDFEATLAHLLAAFLPRE